MISTLCWFDFTPFCFLLSCCSELGLFLCHEGQESKVEQHKQQSRFISPSHRKSRDRGGSVVARFSVDCFLLSAPLSGISASSQGSSSTGLQSVCQNQSGPHSPTATCRESESVLLSISAFQMRMPRFFVPLKCMPTTPGHVTVTGGVKECAYWLQATEDLLLGSSQHSAKYLGYWRRGAGECLQTHHSMTHSHILWMKCRNI